MHIHIFTSNCENLHDRLNSPLLLLMPLEPRLATHTTPGPSMAVNFSPFQAIGASLPDHWRFRLSFQRTGVGFLNGSMDIS